jgi:hypothetical protein
VRQHGVKAKEKSGSNKRVPTGQRLRAIFDSVFGSHEEAEEFHCALENERKNDFGRPLPDFDGLDLKLVNPFEAGA